ncbi:hypothetical protein BDV59DRAFT_211167 [Aspergillus ambiguus]|uniref:flavin-containing monooxygenase n=1 Tax=Aspergillus ambiguus TaxID=176160 RepID=UPI003CCE2CD3
MSVDTDVLIIGAGFSGLGFAIQLQKQYPQASFEIIEKTDNVGGTWWVNTYPGCGCDVASHFYSFSFALNPNWSRKFALQPEIAAYCRADATFDEPTGTWLVTVRDQPSGRVYQKRARVLVSAVGALSVPRECEIPGVDSYTGRVFHSARWDHSFDWTGKDVVVVGNGCSATQFVPILTGGAHHVVQFSRQAHWLAERPNPEYSRLFKWTMRWVPLAMRAYRFYLYYMMERDFGAFATATGGDVRAEQKRLQSEYIRRAAPARYREALVPTTEIGCKRKVLDTDYLACLHRANMELMHDDPVERFTPAGVRTRSGREVPADAVILANGFQTQQLLHPLVIRGEGGVTLNEHWERVSSGAPQAYYGTCVSGFPNLFVLMGPNTTTGHLSVIYSVECQTNFALRLLAPVLGSLRPSSSLLARWNPFARAPSDTVAVTDDAEQRDNSWIQSAASQLVWATGCTSWYIDARTGRNTMLYPDWQFKFWLRSVFFPSRDFVWKSSRVRLPTKTVAGRKKRNAGAAVVVVSAGLAVAAALYAVKSEGMPPALLLRDVEERIQRVFRMSMDGIVSAWKSIMD